MESKEVAEVAVAGYLSMVPMVISVYALLSLETIQICLK